MTTTLAETERDRRWARLQELIEDEGLDALVLAANDYRGHRGTLRWVGDFDLVNRYGYALARRRSALCVLQESATASLRSASISQEEQGEVLQ